MEKISLPDVTLIVLTNQKFYEHLSAVEKSCEGIEFGDVKIIYDLKCDSIEKWNEKIIKELPKYVFTSHALLIHSDGYVTNPHLWDSDWLNYDYCGSPWPLPQDDFSYRDEDGGLVRVGNSVSLRSKKLMDLAATRPVEFRYGNNNEDGHICCWNRKWLESQGCKFLPFEKALHFGKEAELPENQGMETFLFHTHG